MKLGRHSQSKNTGWKTMLKAEIEVYGALNNNIQAPVRKIPQRMCEGCIHWFIIDCGTLDSEPAVIRHWAMLCNYTDSVNDVISYLDKFSSWTGLNNCECICEFFVCFFLWLMLYYFQQY